MIPPKFEMEFGDELSDVATLSVTNDHFWLVGLEKPNREIWFDDGWQDFMEHHSIVYGNFLVFRYEGNSKFNVLVFDHTVIDIKYPRIEDCELEDEVDIIDLDDSTKSSRKCRNVGWKRIFWWVVFRRKGKSNPRMWNPTNPSFMAGQLASFASI
jgi:hypothetical protein